MDSVDAAGLGIGDEFPTRVMGVLNVSEESPYDPSVFDDASEAATYVDEELLAEGADIVDVGLESANKRFDVLSADEELERLDTAVEAMASTSGDAVWSIETRYGEVAAAALDAGFDMVNDIAGFADPELPAVCDARDVAVAKMASPPDLTRPGAVEETPWSERKGEAWAASADYVDEVYEALKQNGLTDKTIVDPAFGGWSEAKTIADDRETFRRLREFRALECPVLVSINRKNFLRSLTDRSTANALASSLAATSLAIDRGAHVIRTHDVRETVDAVAVGDAFTRERVAGDVRDSEGDERSTDGDGSIGAGDSADARVEALDVRTRREASRHAERLGVAEDLVASSVGRAFELDGLEPSVRRELSGVAAETPVAFAPVGDRGCVLAGPAPAFDDLETAYSGTSEVLSDVLERLAAEES